MRFLNWLFGKEEPKSFDIDFELFKSFGKEYSGLIMKRYTDGK